MKVNDTTTATDLALCLRDEEGTFIVQNGGNLFRVTAQLNHSITRMTSIGEPLPFLMPPGGAGAPHFIVTKVNDSIGAADRIPDVTKARAA